ncbi:hypothetical protein H6P81_016211 [Aristolochia fimbriata]|uniref:RING-type E3 ubiquitin transferase n=1 Tax=Aristolochia fimbriata TaxID=158543 RepID=A0AAV7EAQ6_ARIFI|nr:hypothetical protein H6P81_016211 [Aristolochia fimbriata]
MASGHPPEVSPLALSIYGGALFLLVLAYLIIRFCLEKHLPALPRFRQETAEAPPPPNSRRQEDVANSTLEMIPAYKYSKRVLPLDGTETSCAVCLSEFKEGEEVLDLPHCAHFFHAPCIDTWLSSHSTCPICRTSSLTAQIATRPPDSVPSPEPDGDTDRGR